MLMRGTTTERRHSTTRRKDMSSQVVDLLVEEADRRKQAPGAALAPPAINMGRLRKKLWHVILSRRPYSDDDIRLVAEDLRDVDQKLGTINKSLHGAVRRPFQQRKRSSQRVEQPSQRRKRNPSKLLEIMGRFKQAGITDYRLPIKAADLSSIMPPGPCARFEEQQGAVLLDALRSTKLGAGEHSNLRTNKWDDDLEEVRKIGEGNSGQVYQVRSRDTGEVYALKLIGRGKASNEKSAGEEMSMLRRVKHNNIVSLVGSFTSPDLLRPRDTAGGRLRPDRIPLGGPELMPKREPSSRASSVAWQTRCGISTTSST